MLTRFENVMKEMEEKKEELINLINENIEIVNETYLEGTMPEAIFNNAKKLIEYDNEVISFGDERILDAWLSVGIPDESTIYNYIDIAMNLNEMVYVSNLKTRLTNKR